MSSPTLKVLMNERQWEQEWPALAAAAYPVLPAGWTEGLRAINVTHTHFDEVQAVASLLKGDAGATPTVRQLRKALAEFDQWNDWAEDHLTYPASLKSFGAALAAGLSDKSSQVRELTQKVVYCYPERSWKALEADPAFQATLPPELVRHWWPQPAPALEPSVAPAPEPWTVPAAPASAPAAPAPAPAPAPSARPARREDTPAPHRTYDLEAKWPREVLLPLVRAHAGQPAALVSQELAAALSQHQRTTHPKPWVEETLLPSLMSLKASELQELMTYWPTSGRYEVKSPVELVNQPKFWAQLRDAEPEAQRQLIRHVLPLVVKGEIWSTEDRLRMLRVMMQYAQNKMELFEQRLELWQHWGGQLNEPGVLNGDRKAANNEDAFGTSSAAKSALDWIREKNLPVWNQWLARHDGAAAPDTPASTSTTPAPRRPRPR